MRYIPLVILWIAWCFIHSGMISITVTGYMKTKLGKFYKFYRIIFNSVALITLVPLILYSQHFKGNILFQWKGYLSFVQIILFAVSMILFIAGASKYDILEFSGIRQIITGRSYSALSEKGEIATSGILGVTRHPWYLGAVIFIWVAYKEMYVSTLIVNTLLTLYLIVGTLLEERKIILEFGKDYRNYMARVSMLFPFKWLLSRL